MTTASLPLAPSIERAVAPLDRLRRALMLGLVRVPGVGALVARRDAMRGSARNPWRASCARSR